MSEETLDPKPKTGSPRINTGTVKKAAPKPRITGLGYSLNEGDETIKPVGPSEGESKPTPDLKIKIKPKVDTGGTGFLPSTPAPEMTPAVRQNLTRATEKAEETFEKSVKTISPQEIQIREQELESLQGKELDVETLFTATKDYDGVKIGNQKINSPEELEQFLSDPNQRQLFYAQEARTLNKFFGIVNEKDLANKLGGGLTESERSQYLDPNLGTIYDPVFAKKRVAVGEPGYRSEYDQFAPDPIAEQYQIAQKQFQANQQFGTLKNQNIATDAYGQPFKNAEDFYRYLRDPLNRDAYQRRFGKQLKEMGFSNANELLKPIFIGGSSMSAAMSRVQEDSKMRIDKGTDIIKRDIIGKSANVFDENEASSSLPEISEKDLGRLLYEYELGNSINYDIPKAGGRGYTSVNRDNLAALLEKNGLDPVEVDDLLNKFKSEYEQTLGVEDYQTKRMKLGFRVDEKGTQYSVYDDQKESRALSELSETERKISTLYDEVRAIYETGKKVKGKNNIILEPAQQKKVDLLRSQIEQLKRDSGFFGFNAIPTAEFFDPEGKRLEGEEQKKTQAVYSQTLQQSKKSDIAILKEKRNVLYEQLDALESKYKSYADNRKAGIDFSGKKIVLPENYDREKLNADFEAAKQQNSPFIVKFLKGLMPTTDGSIMFSDQDKANLIYVNNIRNKILEKKAQLKAVNQIIYTNADVTKLKTTGILSTMVQDVSKTLSETFTGEMYLTPSETINNAANYLRSNGFYVNPEVVKSLEDYNENDTYSQSILGSLGAMVQLGMYGKGAQQSLKGFFTSKQAVAARSYMAHRYGKTGVATFSLLEKAAVTYGVQFVAYEQAGEDGTAGVAEELGSQAFDAVSGVMKLGKFIPSNVIGRLTTLLGRYVSGAAGNLTEETFSNIWTEFKANGFDVKAAVRDAYGHTDDERLLNFRALALSSSFFPIANVGNLNIMFMSRQEYAGYLNQKYGTDIPEVDREVLGVLDRTIKNTERVDDTNSPAPEVSLATATVSGVQGRANATDLPMDQPMVMSTGPVESDQRTTSSSESSSGVGSEGVQVEKRTGNIGEEFYVSSKNGVVDNKVVYRYNSETGQLEAKGLTSVTEAFVTVNEKTREFIESESKTHGIVSKEKVDNLAVKNIEERNAERQQRESGEPVYDNRVAYQAATQTGQRKKERITKVEQSAKSRFGGKFQNDAQARVGLFTGIAEEKSAQDAEVKDTATEMSRGFGTKMKINLTSFFKDGKAVITDLARKKAAKVGDYMAALFKDFDSTLFETVDTDLNTGQSVRERSGNAITDKVRESVSRNTLFNQVFGTMIAEGRMSKEDAIDNFIINLLQNSTAKVKEIFGNDKAGIENFSKLRKDFNNFVAVKYTGANTFSATNNFVRNTPMSTSTTKNRRADLKKQAAELAVENQKRNETAQVLSNTEEKGSFITGDQVDAARFLDGEISADEFLENINREVPSFYTADQIKSMADVVAKGMIDYDKYTAAKELIAQNDAVREKYRKELTKDLSESFDLKASITKPFQWRKKLKEKRASAEAYLRTLEAAAIRAGMTLDNFMQIRFQILKRTEEQFQDWLNMNPKVIPFYQEITKSNPAVVYANINKAMELKEKNVPLDKITLLTGITFNSEGEPTGLSKNIVFEKIKPDATVPKINFQTGSISYGKGTVYETLLDAFRYAVGSVFDWDNRSPYSKFISLGKRSNLYSNTNVFLLEKILSTDQNSELFENYPDLSLSNIRIISDLNYPVVSFVPNQMYTGNGRSQQRPGDIVINILKLENLAESINVEKDFERLFDKVLSPSIQQSVRNAMLYMEGELAVPETVNFITPSSVRAKVSDLKSQNLIDDNTETLVNNVLDFYIDKNLFQYAGYTNLFTDIASALYYGASETATKKHIEVITSKYDLSTEDQATLNKIYTDYVKSYSVKDATHLRKLHYAFNVMSKLAGLNNDQIISADIKNELNLASKISGKTITRKSVSDLSLESKSIISGDVEDVADYAADLLSNKRLFNLIDEENVPDEIRNGIRYLKEIYQAAKNLEEAGYDSVGENDPSLIKPMQRFYKSLADGKMNQVMDTLSAIIEQREVQFKDGSVGPIFDFQTLMEMDARGELIPEPHEVGSNFESSIKIFSGQLGLDAKLDSENKIESIDDGNNTNAKEFYYSMFPGIDTFMDGIYDPFKKISDFTEAELRTALVESNLISESKFNEIYSDYQTKPNLFTGSVASNFLENLSPLTQEEQIALRDKLKVRAMVEKNIGTAFYSNAEFAVAKIIAQDKGKGVTPAELRALLLKYGAKSNELKWHGLESFIESKKENERISSSDLLAWASNIPSVIAYDESSLQQVRSISSVNFLGFSPAQQERVVEIFDEDKVVPTPLSSGKKPDLLVAIKFDDGSVELVDLKQILERDIDTFSYFVGNEKYQDFKKAFDDLKKFKVDDLTPENKAILTNLIKSFVQKRDELTRDRRKSEYATFQIPLDGNLDNTYQEHLFTVPISQNRLFKSYNDEIISVLSDMSTFEDSVNKQSGPVTKEQKNKLKELEAKLNELVKERNSLAQDYYNTDHFTGVPQEILLHLRTSIAIDSNGEKVLVVHEIQSDKTQNYRTLYKNAKDRKSVKETIEKTTPFLETEQYASFAIKHAMKVALDSGVKKITFANGPSIGVTVGGIEPDKRQGMNNFYNRLIPNLLSKLSKELNFKVGATKMKLHEVMHSDNPNDPKLLQLDPKKHPTLKLIDKPADGQVIKLDKEKYPFFKLADETLVKNEGQEIEIALLFKELENKGDEIDIELLDPAFVNTAAKDNESQYYIQGDDLYSIELTDDNVAQVTDGMAMFQQNQGSFHGATVKLDTGKTIVFALTNPDVSTAMHELAHVWEQYMTATEKQAFLDEIGQDKWDRTASEAFARGFEKYLYDGKAPNGSMQAMFDNFKKWLLKIYGGIVGTPIEMEVSEPMRKIYDAMLGGTKVDPLAQRKSTDIFDDIGNFIQELKANPQFDGVTDDELYTALMRSGFEPEDVQDYFSLKQRANIAKQQQTKGPFQQEADLIQDEAEAMRVVRDQKALVDEIENMDPTEYPIILQTLFDVIDDGDVPLAKAIMDLISAKQNGGDAQMIANQYSAILKAGTSVGRMLQLFRQLTKDTYLTSAEGMFRRNEKKGLNIPEKAKDKIRSLAVELDQIKERYKQSRAVASSDPYGISSADPSKTNLQYHIELYDKLQEAAKRFVDARMPFEGDDSITDMYRSFIKGGLMTPGSMSVNTLSNVSKFLTGFLVDPIKSAISLAMYKTGITSQQYTKSSLKDYWTGTKFMMKSGLPRAWKILKDGTMTQGYQNPDSYVQGFSFYKSFAKFFGLKLDQLRRAAGQLDATDEELADKHGFKLNMEGKIPTKQQAIAGLQSTFGIIPDIVFRVMGATDAVFRDFAYYAAVSEQFKFTKEHSRYEEAIKNAKDSKEKQKLQEEYKAVRKAYIQINSDFQNSEANEEAMRYVYTNDNAITNIVTKVQGITREKVNENSVGAKITRLVGTGIIPFTRIPSNYAVELMEFFIPEYALTRLAVNGMRAYNRSRKMASGEELGQNETLRQRGLDARSADRVLARALVGTGLQFIALEVVKAGAVSGAPSDENEEDKQKSTSYSYAAERPYSINLTLMKDAFKQMMDPNYVSKRRSRLWDKETDLIIDYRPLGVVGAALYIQFKENKLALDQANKYINRGEFAKITEDFALNLFGNFKSAGSYIIDQTFVRGIMSVAKAFSDEDENKTAAFLADLVSTLSAGMVPNSLSFIDKMNRKFVVDYDAKEAPEFKAFGIKVQDPQLTLFYTKLGTKLAERWPFGQADAYVDLPFVETNLDLLPVKVDCFGKAIEQTPKGASMGKFMYNTFDVFKASRVLAGYDTPDWESLATLAVKKGDIWEAIPAMLPRSVKTPSGLYKYSPEQYNNLLQYNSMIKRQLVQEALINTKLFEQLIDVNSTYNRDPLTKKPKTGVDNINVLLGYEQLGTILSTLYSVANKITNVAAYSFIDKQRKKLYEEDPDRFYALIRREMLSPLGEMQTQLYGGQEQNKPNFAQTEKELNKFNIDASFITNPDQFKKYATGVMKLFKDFNGDPKTMIINAQNMNTDPNSTEIAIPNSYTPLDNAPVGKKAPVDKKSPVVEAVKKQREQVQGNSSGGIQLPAGYDPL